MIIDFLHLTASCLKTLDLSQGLYISLFIAGLVGGFSHCTLMCGPFVLAQSQNIEKLSGALLLPYHLGRITTYTLMAVVLATVLNMAFLFMPIRTMVIAPLLMVAGVMFLVTAMPSLAKLFPWAGRVHIGVPFKYLQRGFNRLAQRRGFFAQYLTGLLLGFMPCGMIVAVLMAALAAPNVVTTALAMISFGLGTMPALVLVALGGGAMQRKYPQIFGQLKHFAMMWSAIWLFIMAGYILI